MEIDNTTEDAGKRVAAILSDLHTVTMPHKGQIGPGRSLFYEGKKLIVVECGRKWGKTECLIYSLYRYALCNPSTFSYYFAPQANQIMDLVWANGRLPYYLPDNLAKKYIESINHTDKRITFKNGSFIKCDGSDNYEKARGYSATGLTVYDEAKDHNPKFHDAFEPNLAITDSPLLVVGTPGDGNDPLTRLAETAKILPTGAYFNFPSHMNPHISHDFLARKKLEYEARGEHEVYQIEYEAKRIKLGTKFIFPMLTKSVIKPYEDIKSFVLSERKDYDFYVGFDPGSSKCFAVGFYAIHRFDKHIIQLDEIYANKFGENSVGKIIPVTIAKMKEINPNKGDWMAVYDNAAAWFANEVMNDHKEFDIPLFPCTKDISNKEVKLSLIKDILIKGLFNMTDRCVKSYWEMENYKTDDNGRIVKENDHCFTGETLINTANGLKRIDSVSVGDFVCTRRGLRPVLSVFDNGEKEVSTLILSNGISIDLTEDHRVYTLNRGFVEAKGLTGEDVLCMENVSKLSLMETFLSAGLNQRVKVFRRTIDALKGKAECFICTERFGKVLMAIYLMAMMFITKTGMHIITVLKILNLLPRKSISTNTGKKGRIEQGQKNSSSYYQKLGTSQKSGMQVRMVKNGTPSKVKRCGLMRFSGLLYVNSVLKSLKQEILQKLRLSFAQIIVGRTQEDSLVSIMLKDVVLSALLFLQLISTQKTSIVHALAIRRTSGRKERVFDLMVGEDHEYYANGILVHNCIDQFRYVMNLANYYKTEDARPVDFTKQRNGNPIQDFYEERSGEIYGDIDVNLFDG